MADFVSQAFPEDLSSPTPDSPAPSAFFEALDQRVPTSAASYFLFVSGAPTPPANPAPIVTFVSPLAGSVIAQNRALQFTVNDNDTALLIVSVRFAAVGVEEVAYWGGRFADQYSQSQLTVLGDVSTFVLVRTNGWVSDPTVQVAVSDGLGQVA